MSAWWEILMTQGAKSLGPLAWKPPSTFDGYRLVRLLGWGAMGAVYEAHDTVLDRPVAVKFLSSVEPDDALRERFRIEARALARVQHPNVVDVYRAGEVERHPYLVSEFLRGQSLARLPKPLEWQRVLEIGIGLARGLAAAHRRRVLHRDIKPANAFLTEEGQVKLLDFGVAKLLDTAAVRPAGREGAAVSKDEAGEDTIDHIRTTDPFRYEGPPDAASGARTTRLIGTPLYMAPEIWRGEPATVRSDLYSLGVVLYELCSGTTPYRGGTRRELREAVAREPAVPLTQVAPEVEPAFAALISRCLAHSPADRFPSAKALCEALEALARSHPVPAREASEEEEVGSPEPVAEMRARDRETPPDRQTQGKELAALRCVLEFAAKEWQRRGKVSEHLWSGRQLEKASQLDEGTLSPLEVEFIRASQRVASMLRKGRAVAAVEVLESALMTGSRHAEVRRQFAEVLYQHIRLAEHEHEPALRALLSRGLKQVDDAGVYRRRLGETASSSEGEKAH
jgi:serine/threonine protein kinase